MCGLPVCQGLMTFPGRARLTLIVRQWILGIAHWLLRACRAVRIELRPIQAADSNPAYGMQLHHPRFLEFIGAPESARLLYRPMGEEDAVAAAINLQRDAGVMLSNLLSL